MGSCDLRRNQLFSEGVGGEGEGGNTSSKPCTNVRSASRKNHLQIRTLKVHISDENIVQKYANRQYQARAARFFLTMLTDAKFPDVCNHWNITKLKTNLKKLDGSSKLNSQKFRFSKGDKNVR